MIDHQAVWQILVAECGANPSMQYFDTLFPQCREFRFCGRLGFGGKIYARPDGTMYVSCYPEDETPERLRMIEAANKALAGLAEITHDH